MQTNITEKKITLEKKDEARNCFLEEIRQRDLISRKHKKFFTTLNNNEQLLVSVSVITACVSI